MKGNKVKVCSSFCLYLGIVTLAKNVKLQLLSGFLTQTEQKVELSASAEQMNVITSPTTKLEGQSFTENPRRPFLDSVVEQRVFRSARTEERLPAAVFGVEHEKRWRERVRNARVVALEAGCGRPTNRLATFADGSRACVRYGIDPDQVLGETLSFYLAQLLGISNLPPLVLSKVNLSSEQWSSVRESILELEWSPNAIVSLTEFIPNVSGVFLPLNLQKQQPLSAERISNVTLSGYLVELMQWSDLIIFDYLTANFDRIVSHIFSLQWDARVMERTTNNLLKTLDGDLIFIDNEAGLVHGYRVLNLWEGYHAVLLRSLCIFRRSTVERISELMRSGSSARMLNELYRAREPLGLELGSLSEEHKLLLNSRIERVHRHIKQCSELM